MNGENNKDEDKWTGREIFALRLFLLIVLILRLIVFLIDELHVLHATLGKAGLL